MSVDSPSEARVDDSELSDVIFRVSVSQQLHSLAEISMFEIAERAGSSDASDESNVEA